MAAAAMCVPEILFMWEGLREGHGLIATTKTIIKYIQKNHPLEK
jgi:hypothetical protein